LCGVVSRLGVVVVAVVVAAVVAAGVDEEEVKGSSVDSGCLFSLAAAVSVLVVVVEVPSRSFLTRCNSRSKRTWSML